MTDTTRFVSIDISKSSLDVCILPDGRSASFANSAEGIADFLVFIEPFCGIERLFLEPAGGYERHVVAINVKQARQFAKACGQLSKTDKVDAFILADFARRTETRIVPQRSSQEDALVDLGCRYRQLSHMIVLEKNRREQNETLKDWIEEILYSWSNSATQLSMLWKLI